MGLDNLDNFQKNFSEIMTEMQKQVPIPDEVDNYEEKSESIVLENDDELQKELDELKKNLEN